MTIKFKDGDRVRVKSNGKIGTIGEVDQDEYFSTRYRIVFDKGTQIFWQLCGGDELELLAKPNPSFVVGGAFIPTPSHSKDSIENTLSDRGKLYGEFTGHARITQNIKRALVDSPNWKELPDDMKEALEMLAHKIGRILNGDPNYHDSWHDIIGYTKLVADRIKPPPVKERIYYCC